MGVNLSCLCHVNHSRLWFLALVSVKRVVELILTQLRALGGEFRFAVEERLNPSEVGPPLVRK